MHTYTHISNIFARIYIRAKIQTYVTYLGCFKSSRTTKIRLSTPFLMYTYIDIYRYTHTHTYRYMYIYRYRYMYICIYKSSREAIEALLDVYIYIDI